MSSRVNVILALVVALAISYFATPLVKKLAVRVHAVDIPKDNRRMHDHPIPLMGGLAIVLGCVISILLFSDVDRPLLGILFGALIIAAVGIVDDIHPLGAGVKLVLQILAALVAVWNGVVIQTIANPFVFLNTDYLDFGLWSVPITVIWIVAVTNSVNLIDGLDGLADGVSTISAMSMLFIALLTGNFGIAVIPAALTGACLGFLPYNKNPAQIFMGDTGSTFLGFMLATVSVTGLFKFYAVISFVIPFLILGFPIFDTVSAIVRRLLKGQSPMKADRSHTHHKLIDMGMNQKQAVVTLYHASAALGIFGVMAVTTGYVKGILAAVALIAVALTVARIARAPHDHKKEKNEPENHASSIEEEHEEQPEETEKSTGEKKEQ